jgi:quercetin dioxygenase-like cupin family protein
LNNIFEKELSCDQDLDWQEVAPGIKRKIMTYSEGLMLVKVAFEKGAIGVLHKHPHLQVTYIAEGKFTTTVNGNSKLLVKGDVFYAPTNVEHGVFCEEEGMLIDVFNPYREDFV